MLTPSLALVLLLLVLTFTVTCCDAQPTVLAVSGCMDIGNTTTDCTFPAQLTIRGSGFLTGISSSSSPSYYANYPCAWVRATLQASTLAVQSGWSPITLLPNTAINVCNDTYVVLALIYGGYDMYTFGQLLTITMGSRFDVPGSTSAPFPGVVLKQIPRPIVTGISGCPGGVSGDGLTTSSCLPDRDRITLTGSGFSGLDQSYLSLVIGSAQGLTLVNGQSASSLTLVSDTTLTFSLDYFYAILLQAHDFGGPSVPIYLQERYTGIAIAGTVYAQFAPLPTPNITGVRLSNNADGACQWTSASKTALTGCVAGLSLIMWTGNYIYDMQVLVGGQPMTTLDWYANSATQMYLSLPVYNYQAGVAYEVVFSNGNASITWPSYITFNTAPAIPLIQGCRDSYWNTGIGIAGGGLYCLPGETMLMQTVNIPATQPPFTVIITDINDGTNSTCVNPRYATATQLACDVPSGNIVFNNNRIVVQWQDGASALATRFRVSDYTNAPRIFTVTGCGVIGSANLTLTQCQGGEGITMAGTRFSLLNYTASINTESPYAVTRQVMCVNTLVVNDQLATCELPYIEDYSSLSYNTPLYLRLTSMANSGPASSPIVVTFIASPSASTTTPSASTGTSSLNSTVVALSVLLAVVGCLLITVVALSVYRWRSIRKPPSPRYFDSEGADRIASRVAMSDSQDLEMA